MTIRKTAILFIFLLLGIIIMLFAEPEPVADSEAARYLQALQQLTAQQEKGISNADLFNQMGLAHYHQGSHGKAALFFYRALRLDSAHREARNNLSFLRRHSLDRALYPQSSFLSTLFASAYAYFNLNRLALVSLLLLIALTLCLHRLLHLPPEREKAPVVMWLLIFSVLLLAFAIMLGFKYSSFQDDRRAVVIDEEVKGYPGPAEEFSSTFTIHAGLPVLIERSYRDRALVFLPNGSAGWVAIDALERINPK